MRTQTSVPHRFKRAALAALAIASLGMAASAAIASPASASDGVVTPMACDEYGTHYRVWSKQDYRFPAGIDFKSGPGGTTSASIQNSLSATAGFTIGTTVTASAVVAEASASLSISASVTATIAQTYGYSHDIAPGKYGHLQFVNWGWSMGLEKYIYNSSCVLTGDWSGTARLPSANSWGYYYWETSS